MTLRARRAARSGPGRGRPALPSAGNDSNHDGHRRAAWSKGRPPRKTQTGSPILVALFLLSIVVPTFVAIGTVNMSLYRLVIFAAILPLSFQLLSGRAGPVNAVDGMIVGSALWAILAFLMSAPVADVVEPIGLHLVEFLGAYLLGRVCIRSAKEFRRMVILLFCLVLPLGFFAVIESVTHRPILLEFFPQTQPAVYAPGRWGLRRAQTVFAHPIAYGIYVSATLGMVWYVLKPRAGFALRLFLAVLIMIATIFSLSTGALICFNVQLVLILWDIVMRRNPRRWILLAWLTGIGYVTLDLLSNRTPFHLLVDYASFNSGSAYNRILIWHFGTDNVVANPLFGLGLFIQEWERPHWMSPSLDNFWLFIAVKFGLPTFLMFATGVIMILRRAGRVELSDPLDRACRTGFLITMAGLCIAGGTVHYWAAMMAQMMFLLGAGVWLFTGGAQPADAEGETGTRPRRGVRSRDS